MMLPTKARRNLEGVRYHSDGKPSAKAHDGSKVILSGKGGWNPKKDTAKGGGHYAIKGSSGGELHQQY
jgi:hypothetical protein